MLPLARPWPAARSLLVLVAVGAVLAGSACGTSAAEPEPEVAADGGGPAGEQGEPVEPEGFRKGAIPNERHPEIEAADLPVEPEPDDPLSDRMAWTALKEISEFGGKVDPDADTSCPKIGGESGESVTCEVSYLGEDIEYQIDIEESDSVLRYESTAEGMPMLRDVMEAGLRSFEDTEYAVCDMEEIELVTPNEDTGIECRALHEEDGTVVTFVLLATENGAPLFVDEDTELS
ncbi:hypothetical protein F4561_000099 [Lipingzhangella halophila]|uniref:DUF4333 domain-containing protein n=1 Tax=Lipingzhangella halophila TaxID=1783352 RepID=A0A7W7W115_9ACTN|nr:hypothetical protein [Lipingzhangella halophila]MBB4929279.1 hypothetical protein [Lipingzhangella halophila]